MTTHFEQTNIVRKALREAFRLGSTYWQQADSEYASQWKKADATRAEFDTLVETTLSRLTADSELNIREKNT